MTLQSPEPSQAGNEQRSEPQGRGVAVFCDLCGLPARHPIRLTDEHTPVEDAKSFCCNGCRNVWRILAESGQLKPGADLRSLPVFKQAQAMGLLGSLSSRNGLDSVEPVEATPPDELGSVDDVRQCALRVDGMWCASCAWLITETLRRRKGVLSASVSFATDTARVSFKPARIGIEELSGVIRSLGYHAEEAQNTAPGDAERVKRHRRELVRVHVAFASCAMNVMMLTPILYMGRSAGVTPFMAHFINGLILVLSVPVFVCAWPLYDRAIRAARHGVATMETLVTVGATVALAYSIVQIVQGSSRNYLDTADMLLGLVLVGKYIENNIRAGATDAMALLHGSEPKKAVILQTDGSERMVAAAQLVAGDLIRVRAGEMLAADGIIARGAGSLDESLLTGEARPVTKQTGDTVTGGSALVDGAVDVRVGRAASGGGTLQQMVSLVDDSLHRKTRSEQVADRISRVFVPIVMLLAALAAAWVYHESHSIGASITRAVAVLVIACPCALGIATPMAIMAGVGAAARRGILVGDPEALATATRLRRIIFDKTGTLTEGRFRLLEVWPAGADLSGVSAIEQLSEHSIARAIREACASAPSAMNGELGSMPACGEGAGGASVTGFARIEGEGVSGFVHGRRVFAGNARMAGTLGARVPDDIDRVASEWSAKGRTVIYFGADSVLGGIIALGDSFRPGAAKLVRELTAQGIACEIVSGDSPATVAVVAAETGISEWRGGALPGQKAELVADRIGSTRGGAVAMVGDGVNDAPALALADLGIAMAGGADIAGKAAGVTLMSRRIERLGELFAISRATNGVMRQNLFWALGYNLICIPLAMAGHIGPLWAAVAMLVSSLAVVANTRRLAWQLAVAGRSAAAAE